MPCLFPPVIQEQLDLIGGEPLEASGFEDEQLEDGFDDGGDVSNFGQAKSCKLAETSRSPRNGPGELGIDKGVWSV
jgi:hypothetical protein